MSNPTVSKRKRAKLACEPCRQRKRKCDGARPCQTCCELEYDCYYKTSERKRHLLPSEQNPGLRTSTSPTLNTTQLSPELSKGTPAQERIPPMDANSGATFVRELALSLDPVNAPRMHLFAWNGFWGARQADNSITVTSMTELLSEFDMETLVMVYFDKVDPCYGFVDRDEVNRRIKHKWRSSLLRDPYDAVLCGIAALGCLFSRCQSKEVELSLSEAAKVGLERTLSDVPDHDTATGWVLRVAYLRMTSSPHTAWMASCLMMHVIEAASLHREASELYSQHAPVSNANDEIRRRLFGVAQHLNLWISFDVGRTRVSLRNATKIPPSERPGDYTTELLGLLPYTEMLDPAKTTSTEELGSALAIVLERTHFEPPSVLAQTNLVLCLYRRLRLADTASVSRVLDKILTLMARAIRSAQAMLNACSPWHHIANIPFQIICTLLAIDTAASLGQLEDAMQTLENVATTYNTQPLQEAVRTASFIVLLHQRRKEADLAELSSVLRRHPVGTTDPSMPQNGTIGDSDQQLLPSIAATSSWLDGAVANIPYLQNFNIDDFLNDDFR